MKRSPRWGVGLNRKRYGLDHVAGLPIGSVRRPGDTAGMSLRIEMPELSSDGEGATLATWLVSVGDHVEKGDVIAELETDKSTVELEAPVSGTIAALSIAEGAEEIMPGVVLGEIDEVADRAGEKSVHLSTEAPPEQSAAPAASADPIAEPPIRRDSTPLARRAALDRDVDLSTLTGSGPGGRVIEEDVLRSLESNSAPAAELPARSGDSQSTKAGESGSFEVVALSAMRKTIARRMTEAKQQVPHFYLRARCSMDVLLDARAKLNRDLADAGRDTKLSVNDFVIRAAALALRDVPEANVRFAGTEMHLLDAVDISVAVATDGGLLTPVVRDADRKGLATLASEVRALAMQAREGKLRPEQYQGGSFTISNLGMYGIETVYPILNLPQACILGVGAAEEQAVVRNGEIKAGWIAALTLAADHRAVDGAVGARLLASIRERLEDPLGMML